MNVWKKIKNILACFGALLLAVLTVGVCRRRSDRLGNDGIEDILDQCKDDADRASGQNSGIAEELATSTELADGVAEDNRHAAEQLDNALRILEKAEERAKEKSS